MKYTHPKTGDEFVAPLSGWLTTKKLGINPERSDARDKLQYALDGIGKNEQKVIYLDSGGNWNLDKPLNLKGRINISFLGESRKTTRLIWQGNENGTMLEADSVAYSKFSRLLFDGRGKAHAGVNQSWTGIDHFDTGNEYSDIEFINFRQHGIMGGWKNGGFCETAIQRCIFKEIKGEAISLGDFNALDIWIWNCFFENCRTGVSNGGKENGKSGAGNYKVYRSTFKNCGTDMWTGNTGTFSIRECLSIGSGLFYGAGFTQNSSPTIISKNRIIDWKGKLAIYFENQGCLSLDNNIFIARKAYTDPVIYNHGRPFGDQIMIRNTFTVNNYINVGAQVRRIEIGTKVVSRESITNINTHVSEPNELPNLNRPVIEVEGNNLQGAIKKSEALTGQRPVIYFPQSIVFGRAVIPLKSDVQLVGDGAGTVIDGVIEVEGQSKFTTRNLKIKGDVIVKDANQSGGKILLDQLNLSACKVNGLFKNLTITKVIMINGNVAGGLERGIVADNSNVTILCGSASNSNKNNCVTNGGKLTVMDVWYESSQQGTVFFAEGKARLSISGCNTATPEGAATGSAIIKNLDGRVCVYNSGLGDRIDIEGDNKKGKLLLLWVLNSKKNFIKNTGTPPQIKKYSLTKATPNSTRGAGSEHLQSSDEFDENFILSMLTDILNVTYSDAELEVLPEGVTDIRMFRTSINRGTTGLNISGVATVEKVPEDIKPNRLAQPASHFIPLPPPPPAYKPGWNKVGMESNFIEGLPPNSKVRYGREPRWLYKTVNADFYANNEFFGGDPIPGFAKEVWLWVKSGTKR